VLRLGDLTESASKKGPNEPREINAGASGEVIQRIANFTRKCDTFHTLAKRFAYWFLAVSPNTS
jgi:hypothetical protein